VPILPLLRYNHRLHSYDTHDCRLRLSCAAQRTTGPPNDASLRHARTARDVATFEGRWPPQGSVATARVHVSQSLEPEPQDRYPLATCPRQVGGRGTHMLEVGLDQVEHLGTLASSVPHSTERAGQGRARRQRWSRTSSMKSPCTSICFLPTGFFVMEAPHDSLRENTLEASCSLISAAACNYHCRWTGGGVQLRRHATDRRSPDPSPP
jgi:hypothetical protein